MMSYAGLSHPGLFELLDRAAGAGGLDEIQAREHPAGGCEACRDVLDAQLLTARGRTDEARAAVTRARSRFDPEDDAFAAAICDYLEGAAASAQGEHAAAEALLVRAVEVFRHYWQIPWEGRALAALAGSVSRRGDDRGARPIYEAALAALDPVLDALPYRRTRDERDAAAARLVTRG